MQTMLWKQFQVHVGKGGALFSNRELKVYNVLGKQS